MALVPKRKPTPCHKRRQRFPLKSLVHPRATRRQIRRRPLLLVAVRDFFELRGQAHTSYTAQDERGIPSVPQPMNTTQLIQRAEALMSQGNPEEAGKIYEELCRMEQLTAAERGVALFGLGTCLFLHESYAAASLQLRESWELLIASLGMEDPLTTRTMVLLSRTLIALGDLESGMEIGRGALKNLVKLYGQDADQAATAAFFLSSGAYQFGRLAEAEELTLQALQAWEKIYGHVSLQAAACLDALGKLRNVCGEKREGTDFHRRAADIKMQVLGEHETTAASLGHIGMAEAELGNWKEAETLLASSLEQFDRLGVGKNAEGIAAFREKLNECRNMLAKEPTDE